MRPIDDCEYYAAFDAAFCSEACRDTIVDGIHREYLSLVEQVKKADEALYCARLAHARLFNPTPPTPVYDRQQHPSPPQMRS